MSLEVVPERTVARADEVGALWYGLIAAMGLFVTAYVAAAEHDWGLALFFAAVRVFPAVQTVR